MEPHICPNCGSATYQRHSCTLVYLKELKEDEVIPIFCEKCCPHPSCVKIRANMSKGAK